MLDLVTLEDLRRAAQKHAAGLETAPVVVTSNTLLELIEGYLGQFEEIQDELAEAKAEMRRLEVENEALQDDLANLEDELEEVTNALEFGPEAQA